MAGDPRIPVTILADPAAVIAWLDQGGGAALVTDAAAPPPGFIATERFEPSPVHRFGCGCCGGRSGAVIALDRLFQSRARGRCGWFERVGVLTATPAARDQVMAALAGDALTLARYRPG